MSSRLRLFIQADCPKYIPTITFMNDELFLKQLEQIIPQEDSTHGRLYAHADTRQQPQIRKLPTRSLRSVRGMIVWELPAEPRFQVARGGQKGDRKWMRPLVGNLAFLTLFIFALGFWPHSRPRPASTAAPAMPLSSSSLRATNHCGSIQLVSPDYGRQTNPGRQQGSNSVRGCARQHCAANKAVAVRGQSGSRQHAPASAKSVFRWFVPRSPATGLRPPRP